MNLSKFTPKIFAGVAVLGVFSTAILAANAAPEAMKKIEASGARTKREKIKASWRCYIPTAASIAITVASIGAVFNKLAQANAQLALGYGVGHTALRLYSERATKEERKEISGQVMRTQPAPTGEIIQLDTSTDPKDQINVCFDYYCGRYFHASQNQIKRAVDEFNETVIIPNGRGSLNQLYSCFHRPDELPPSATGDILGWKYKDGTGAIPMVTFEPDNNGNPCMIFDFYNPPQDNFNNEFA